jgi:hypothetical protein
MSEETKQLLLGSDDEEEDGDEQDEEGMDIDKPGGSRVFGSYINVRELLAIRVFSFMLCHMWGLLRPHPWRAAPRCLSCMTVGVDIGNQGCF